MNAHDKLRVEPRGNDYSGYGVRVPVEVLQEVVIEWDALTAEVERLRAELKDEIGYAEDASREHDESLDRALGDRDAAIARAVNAIVERDAALAQLADRKNEHKAAQWWLDVQDNIAHGQADMEDFHKAEIALVQALSTSPLCNDESCGRVCGPAVRLTQEIRDERDQALAQLAEAGAEIDRLRVGHDASCIRCATSNALIAERDAALAQLAEASQRYAHRVGAHEAALVQLAAEKARADEEESHTANDYAKDEKLRRALAERTPWPDVVRVQLSYNRDDGAFHVEGGDAEGNGTFIADALIEWLHYSATAGCNPRGDGDAATERAAREKAEAICRGYLKDLTDLQVTATRDHAVAEAAQRLYDATPEEMRVRVRTAEPAGPYAAALYALLAAVGAAP